MWPRPSVAILAAFAVGACSSNGPACEAQDCAGSSETTGSTGPLYCSQSKGPVTANEAVSLSDVTMCSQGAVCSSMHWNVGNTGDAASLTQGFQCLLEASSPNAGSSAGR